MNFYNGFSPRERRAWNGLGRPIPRRCSMCGCGPERSLAYHAEDYRCPDSVYAICRRCHYAIHMRFLRPDHWQKSAPTAKTYLFYRRNCLFATSDYHK